MTAERIYATLVHGTWARRSRWPIEGPLRQRLEEVATCHALRWTGGNSHFARTSATKKLVEHLRGLEINNPGCRKVIVAHSHGGNAALQAVWGLQTCNEFRNVKVVTMATPFLFARATSPSRFPNFLPMSAIYFSVLWVVLSAIHHNPWSWFDFVPLALIIATSVQVASDIWFRWRHGPSRTIDQKLKLVETIQAPLVPADQSSRLLIIRAADDEAGGMLGATQFSGWLALTAARIIGPARALTAILAAATLLSFFPLFGLANTGATLFVLRWALPAAYIILLLATLPAIASLAQGFDGPTTSRFAIVTAEASPPGECTIWQLELRESTAAGLAHSSLYNEPSAIERIVAFVTND